MSDVQQPEKSRNTVKKKEKKQQQQTKNIQ